MSKILIWDLNIPLVNGGGPSGYLYNIHHYLESGDKNNAIIFLSDLMKNDNKEAREDLILKFKKSALYNLYRKVAKYRYFFIDFYGFLLKKDKLPDIIVEKIYEFDSIHFHSSIDIHKSRKLLTNYKGTVLLTSHCPQPFTNELLEKIPLYKCVKSILSSILYRTEISSWNLSHYIMFPVPEALEPYKKHERFKKYIESHENKFVYCPSAILSEPTFKNISIREKLNISQNAFLICYIGRHNQVKGYDELKKFGELVLNKYNDIYFVIGGKEEPIRSLKHDRWIELGWIDFGNDILRDADLFVLPNAETYFDLITLEVLRIGTPILMSRTGGNKFFEAYSADCDSGIKLYEYGNLDDEMNTFYYFYEGIKKGKKEKMREQNNNIFRSSFTVKEFVDRYIQLLNTIVSTDNPNNN